MSEPRTVTGRALAREHGISCRHCDVSLRLNDDGSSYDVVHEIGDWRAEREALLRVVAAAMPYRRKSRLLGYAIAALPPELREAAK